MTILGEKRISPEELPRIQVDDVDQIMNDLFDKMLDAEWSKEIVSNDERLHQQAILPM